MRCCIIINDWQTLQQYRDRTPKWLKLHRAQVESREFHALSGDAVKFLIQLWLVASDDIDGIIVTSFADLAWQLRTSENLIESLLRECAHFVTVLDASDETIANARRVAALLRAKDVTTSVTSQGELLPLTDSDVVTQAVVEFCTRMGCKWSVSKPIPRWLHELRSEPQFAVFTDEMLVSQFRKAADWYEEKNKPVKRPSSVLRNWLENAKVPSSSKSPAVDISVVRALINIGGEGLYRQQTREDAFDYIASMRPAEWLQYGKLLRSLEYTALNAARISDFAFTQALTAQVAHAAA